MPKRYLLVFGTFLLTVLLYVDRVCISAAKSPIIEDLGLTDKQFGWVLSAFALGYALFQTPGGWFSDRFGPRRVLAGVVVFWSIFTGVTGLCWNWASMLVARFVFGAGEAGAFPGLARATFSWIPMKERGVVQGINFSGSRIGAALALPLIALLINAIGWRESFAVLLVVGLAWALFWYWWFRDDPTEHPSITSEEREYILATRQHGDETEDASPSAPLSVGMLLKSRNAWMLCAQYFCSNFTFFFALTWMYPYIKGQFSKLELSPFAVGLWCAVPLIGGAIGCWFSGWLIDRIYSRGHWVISRRLPPTVGFALAAGGMFAATQTSVFESLPLMITALTVAILGADMTLPSSWSTCIDIGRKHSGVVSGYMNMAGNIGSFMTALAFAYLKDWSGATTLFFCVAGSLNLLAVVIWLFIKPNRVIEEY